MHTNPPPTIRPRHPNNITTSRYYLRPAPLLELHTSILLCSLFIPTFPTLARKTMTMPATPPPIFAPSSHLTQGAPTLGMTRRNPGDVIPTQPVRAYMPPPPYESVPQPPGYEEVARCGRQDEGCREEGCKVKGKRWRTQVKKKCAGCAVVGLFVVVGVLV